MRTRSTNWDGLALSSLRSAGSALPDHGADVRRFTSSYPARRPNTDCRSNPTNAWRPFLPVRAPASILPAIALYPSASSSSRYANNPASDVTTEAASSASVMSDIGFTPDRRSLAEKYPGHRDMIDWGRQFLEGQVLPELKSKNDQYLATDKATSAYFWVHRDAPEVVKEALRVLCYTGVVSEQASGIKATRAEVGTRYMANLGCLFSLESTPTTTSFELAKGLSPHD